MSGTRQGCVMDEGFRRELRTTTAQASYWLPRMFFLVLADMFVTSPLWSISVNGGL